MGAPDGGWDQLTMLHQNQVAQLELEGHCLGLWLPLSPQLELRCSHIIDVLAGLGGALWDYKATFLLPQ